jgi:hypothetical protein
MSRWATSESGPAASAPRRQRSSYAGSRARARQYEIKYMPPPWKRSLTESGMSRKATRWDVAVVVAVVVVFAALLVWGVAGGNAGA